MSLRDLSTRESRFQGASGETATKDVLEFKGFLSGLQGADTQRDVTPALKCHPRERKLRQ